MNKSILRPPATFAVVTSTASQPMSTVIPRTGFALRLLHPLLLGALFLAQLSLPELSTAAPYHVLHNFPVNTAGPITGVVVDGSIVYGTVGSVLYAMNTDGSNYHTIHSFNGGANGTSSSGDLTLIGSNLYGTSVSGGVGTNSGLVFSLNKDGSDYQVCCSANELLELAQWPAASDQIWDRAVALLESRTSEAKCGK